MNALATAIYNRGVSTSNFKTAINSRLYFVRPNAQPPVFPYVAFFIVDHPIEYFFGSSTNSSQSVEDILCQFNIHSNTVGSSSEAGTILGYLTSQYDFCSLSVTGYNSHKMERKNIFGPFWIAEDESWVYSIEYKVYIQKS